MAGDSFTRCVYVISFVAQCRQLVTDTKGEWRGDGLALYIAIAVDFYMTITKMCQEFRAQIVVSARPEQERANKLK